MTFDEARMLFQFQKVRLKARGSHPTCVLFAVSIPKGSIKSVSNNASTSRLIVVSIPKGSIKRLRHLVDHIAEY